MYRDGSISYDSDAVGLALNESKKVSEMAGAFKQKCSGVKASIPQNFNSDQLLTVLRDMTTGNLSSEKALKIEEFL